MVLAGEDRFWIFAETLESFSWENVQSYETDLDEVHYSYVTGGDFDGDGRQNSLRSMGIEISRICWL